MRIHYCHFEVVHILAMSCHLLFRAYKFPLKYFDGYLPNIRYCLAGVDMPCVLIRLQFHLAFVANMVWPLY